MLNKLYSQEETYERGDEIYEIHLTVFSIDGPFVTDRRVTVEVYRRKPVLWGLTHTHEWVGEDEYTCPDNVLHEAIEDARADGKRMADEYAQEEEAIRNAVEE